MFSKTTIAIRFNLLQVYPSVSPFVLTVLFVSVSFNVLRAHFYASLHLEQLPPFTF